MANLLLVSCQNGPQGEADVISRSAHLRSLFSQIYAARFALPAGSAGKTTFWSLFSGRAKQLARCFFLSKSFTSSLTFTFVLTAATFRLVRDRQESMSEPARLGLDEPRRAFSPGGPVLCWRSSRE